MSYIRYQVYFSTLGLLVRVRSALLSDVHNQSWRLAAYRLLLIFAGTTDKKNRYYCRERAESHLPPQRPQNASSNARERERRAATTRS